MFVAAEHQHIRFNPLKDEWVLVSPHRCKRPWSGQTEPELDQPQDPNNPLGPGAVRANGQKNPDYTSTYVFPNDFPALLENVPEPPASEHPLFQSAQATGTCRVMCFHPDPSMTISLMSIDDILNVIEEWVEQYRELGARYTWVQVFENKGSVMGCSNPHPHCQIWASNFLPNEPRIKDRCQKDYYKKNGKPLLMDYLEQELEKQERIVVENSSWAVIVPYWASWPFETLILPKEHIQRMTDMDAIQMIDLADIMHDLTVKYDNLFECNFPYSMGWHGAPTGSSAQANDSPHWVFHGIYLPPLLRSASVKKFMVGFELLAQAQRDLTPEQAAQKLMQSSLIHYKSVSFNKRPKGGNSNISDWCFALPTWNIKAATHDTVYRNEHQHIRFNPLKDEWVLVSPHRCKRPWSGQTEPELDQPQDPNNPLGPGAVRANGQKNPDYTSTYVFPNDFPALLENVPEPPESEHPLFQSAQATGTCRVMCFHPDPSMTISLMSIDDILNVIEEWVEQYRELGARYTWVQVFENKGSVMGCSNPHPHCQIWASNFLPNEPRIKDRCQKDYYTKNGKPLLMEYLEQELEKKERIVVQNGSWAVIVPYWASWPFETLILPKKHLQRMTDMNAIQMIDLADIMHDLTVKYDNLFECNFPYSMGWHGAPTGSSAQANDSPHWVFHGIYLPPLLRSASVKKFMVGFELLAQAQRDLTPEQAAQKLMKSSLIHYKNK